jgi:hypothetical protein
MTTPRLTPEIGGAFARLALAHVGREYPNVLQHMLAGPDDVQSPRALHPIFFGSLDWHSCVHGWWLLARVRRRFPELPESSHIDALFDERLTSDNVAREREYVVHPMRGTFERPYGWAWLLMLSAELARHDSAEGHRWRATLAPLTAAFVQRFIDFLPRATYPVRAGTHFNTAFAVALALEYAEVADDHELADALRDAATRWYSADTNCQAWEPSGDDFLSPALIEVECMRRVLPASRFARWLDRFLPRLADREPVTLFVPATVSDRSDGKIAHLDGLNLSRAWCWRALAAALPADDARGPIAVEAAERHLAASLPHVTGDYMGEHWLATFGMLALDVGEER